MKKINRGRKPLDNTDRKISIGVGLLPDELKQLRLQANTESDIAGAVITISELARKAILRYLWEVNMPKEA